MKRTTLTQNAMIWFGAAIGLAEILSGTYLAPLGLKKGLLSILLGHAIGCFLLFLAGYIGGKTRKTAMETVTLSFGTKGAWLFSFLNVVQLFGWTAIMIYDGKMAASLILPAGKALWAIVIGGLILVWVLIGLKSLGKLNLITMGALLILTIVLSVTVFHGQAASAPDPSALSFGAAMELSVAMPLSWVPLISDYTREAERPAAVSAVSALVYGLVSCWMYLIGMGAAMYAGTSDIAVILLRAGLGGIGLLIIVLATVTTTFLDAYSAGVSSELFSPRIRGKWVAAAAAVIGTLAAIILPMDDITGFLYIIGSVFAPMIAVQIAGYFLLKERHDNRPFCPENLLVWLAGFLLYRWLMRFDMPMGNTLPDIGVTIVLTVLVSRIRRRGMHRQNEKGGAV